MVNDYSDSERGNLLPPLRGLLFPISRKGSFICTIPHRITYHGLPKKEFNLKLEIQTHTRSRDGFPSYKPVFHDWCNKGRGMCYPVCQMMHIK